MMHLLWYLAELSDQLLVISRAVSRAVGTVV